ncbi:MAG TPA: hypothetical protein PLD47_12600 [Aggregatilineales bacterium]|nr:hypothetical protein [Anaerolineales bacterium]HRE48557.1 hypothetical protein [Aggregatilineales bacterium]
MKLARIFAVVGMFCAVVMLMIAPSVGHVGAQGNSTPAIVIITATPVGGGAQPVEPPVAAPPAGATAAPPEWQAFNAARAYLTKKINKNLKYVTNWTWDLLMFPDTTLGCQVSGETSIKGDTPGYKITIQPLGDSNIYDIRVKIDLSKVYDCGIAGTGASGSPISGGTGSVVSGDFELGGHAQELNANTVQRMKEAKMRWVKKQVRGGEGPSYISQAKANGFKIMLGVVGDKSRAMDPNYHTEYAAWVGSLAAAGADAIEVWNEQNLDREWPNGQISPQVYTQLLAKAYAAIKAANPNTIVISGAPAPTGGAAGGKSAAFWNDDVYMAEMAAAGAGQYADCIGLHYNEGIVSPGQSSGDPRDNYPTRYFGTMLARGLASFPGERACFTELGYLTPEGYGALPGGFAWAQNVTIANQRDWLAEAAVLSAANRVRLMIVWNVDFPVFDGGDPMAGYAIIRRDRSCPACAKLASVIP